MQMDFIRHPKTLRKEETALLVVDLQERLLPVMEHRDRLLENVGKLVDGCKVIGVPVFYTEQYPKGLGHTEESIKAKIGEIEVIEKMSFSCSGADNLFAAFREKNISQVIVCGIESHVCVQQTAFDLAANNFQVNLAADAVSSRKEIDYETALARMRANGIEVTTVESILFELLNVCGTDEFKAVSKIVK